MVLKKVLPYSMMILGLAFAAYALYLDFFTQEMIGEVIAFFAGLILFWGGYYLRR